MTLKCTSVWRTGRGTSTEARHWGHYNSQYVSSAHTDQSPAHLNSCSLGGNLICMGVLASGEVTGTYRHLHRTRGLHTSHVYGLGFLWSILRLKCTKVCSQCGLGRTHTIRQSYSMGWEPVKHAACEKNQTCFVWSHWLLMRDKTTGSTCWRAPRPALSTTKTVAARQFCQKWWQKRKLVR